MKDTPAPVLQDLNSFVKDLPENAKKDAKTAVDLTQKTLEEMDRPGFENREERLGKREAGLERDNAISRALTGIKTGLRVAGSKERTLAGALGKEGSEGIEDLIRGEAANRAAKDKLEDYRDNLEQQKVASKKGNYQAAQAAGERAADNLYKYTNLNLNAASAGNSQAIQRQQVEQQGNFQQASLGQAGILGLAELGLKKDQLAQQGAIAKAQLAAQDKRFAALDKQSQARMLQVRNGALNTFVKEIAPRLEAQLAADPRYGKNWRTGKDPKSLEAQLWFNQQRDAHLANALNLHDERMSYARSPEDLLQTGQ
jgi:hypothetical protein